MSKCRLCGNIQVYSPVQGQDHRTYEQCLQCALIQVTADHLPDPIIEKQRYDLHKNDIQDHGYVQFLHKAIDVTQPYLKTGARILDFGCGRNMVLAQLISQEYALEVDRYDPFYFPDNDMASKKYEIIYTTEVIEHFHHPQQTIAQIVSILAPKGIWCIMTELYKDLSFFSNWYYTRDFTHVAFYHDQTIHYICHQYQLTCLPTKDRRVILLQS
jgi:2-polyprenyl-3-methyl-5-hydroxy-6-metoxy-1,4-benzoquinol methylase